MRTVPRFAHSVVAARCYDPPSRLIRIQHMRAAILSTALTAAIAAGAAYLVWLDYRQTAPTAAVPSSEIQREMPPERIAPTPSPAPAKSGAQASGPNVVYKCADGGRITYQGRPCVDGSDRGMANGTFSVVSPPAIPVRGAEAPREGAGVAMIQRSDTAEPDRACAPLRQEIRWIDAQARVRSTSDLTERRHRVKRLLHELQCPELDP